MESDSPGWSNMKYVVALHGNEIKPLLALACLGMKEGDDYFIGNPLAVSKNTRYVNTDLNRSFGVDGTGYEAGRAKELLEKIPKHEVVVDFHTFSSKTQPFTIIRSLEMVPFARRFNLPIVYMNNGVDHHSLLDYRSGVSIEVGHHDDEKSFRFAGILVQRSLYEYQNDCPLFEVYKTIEEPGNYVDFVDCGSTGDCIPILSGSKAYTHYGFFARKIAL